MAILRNAVENWTEFDAYCLTKGFDPLEVPSRRLVAAAWAFLVEDMDPETKAQLIIDLNTEESFAEVKKVQTSDAKVGVPAERWRAPEGWTPPGWNEEKSMQSAKEFMGFQASL
jgi:hypothetical protein